MEFKTEFCPKVGMKPCFVFCGPDWDNNEKFGKLRNLLIDFFRGKTSEMINLDGLEHVIICTIVSEVVHFRHYAILLKKSGSIVRLFFFVSFFFYSLFYIYKSVTKSGVGGNW